MAEGDFVGAADEGESQESGFGFDFLEERGVRHFHIFEAGVFVGFAGGIEEAGEGEFVDETLDFAGGHGLRIKIDAMEGDTAFFKKPFGGAGGAGAFDAEDLDVLHVHLIVTNWGSYDFATIVFPEWGGGIGAGGGDRLGGRAEVDGGGVGI